MYDRASTLALTELEPLLHWLANDLSAPTLAEDVLSTLGVPEPDYNADGSEVPGSVLRKVLHYANVEYHYARLLTLAEGDSHARR
jgi:hypothetical protein